MTSTAQIEILKKIGKRLLSLEDEFNIILPNFPTLRGNEFIFTISWDKAQKFIDSDVEIFIKGLHVVETLYKNKTQNDFGFGSPSPTHKVIQQLRTTHLDLANELTDWIAEGGGNYYIKGKNRLE